MFQREISIDEVTVIITVYQPTLDIWENNFKTRKK